MTQHRSPHLSINPAASRFLALISLHEKFTPSSPGRRYISTILQHTTHHHLCAPTLPTMLLGAMVAKVAPSGGCCPQKLLPPYPCGTHPAANATNIASQPAPVFPNLLITTRCLHHCLLLPLLLLLRGCPVHQSPLAASQEQSRGEPWPPGRSGAPVMTTTSQQDMEIIFMNNIILTCESVGNCWYGFSLCVG